VGFTLVSIAERPQNTMADVQLGIDLNAFGVAATRSTLPASMSISTANRPIVFTGGVAMVPGMMDALQAAFGHPVATAKNPQLTAALGTALIARDRTNGKC
jgi:activator of 2-hydroxyglutaryl-CoA dehydratase